MYIEYKYIEYTSWQSQKKKKSSKNEIAYNLLTREESQMIIHRVFPFRAFNIYNIFAKTVGSWISHCVAFWFFHLTLS